MKKYTQLYSNGLERKFERNSGDEMQALVRSPDAAVDIILDAVGTQQWWVGVGVGDVERPIPRSVRQSRGPALEHARIAVDRAKRRTGGHRFWIAGDDPLVEDLMTVMTLIALIIERQSSLAREAETLHDRGLTQVEASQRLGISQQSFAERLKRGAVVEKEAGRQLAIRMARTLAEQ
jgi:hypothetical protein